jgi:hypothetical protein
LWRTGWIAELDVSVLLKIAVLFDNADRSHIMGQCSSYHPPATTRSGMLLPSSEAQLTITR